jgi:hypothetical protein
LLLALLVSSAACVGFARTFGRWRDARIAEQRTKAKIALDEERREWLRLIHEADELLKKNKALLPHWEEAAQSPYDEIRNDGRQRILKTQQEIREQEAVREKCALLLQDVEKQLSELNR